MPDVGSLVELRYLYTHALGTPLVQPDFLRDEGTGTVVGIDADKTMCALAQLKVKGE